MKGAPGNLNLSHNIEYNSNQNQKITAKSGGGGYISEDDLEDNDFVEKFEKFGTRTDWKDFVK